MGAETHPLLACFLSSFLPTVSLSHSAAIPPAQRIARVLLQESTTDAQTDKQRIRILNMRSIRSSSNFTLFCYMQTSGLHEENVCTVPLFRNMPKGCLRALHTAVRTLSSIFSLQSSHMKIYHKSEMFWPVPSQTFVIEKQRMDDALHIMPNIRYPIKKEPGKRSLLSGVESLKKICNAFRTYSLCFSSFPSKTF